MIDPISKYAGCSTAEVIERLAKDFNVRATAEDFKKARRNFCVTIHVAAVGHPDIVIHNPEYKVFWWEPTTEFLHTLWRMAKSAACRGTLIRAFKVAYLEIEKHEFTDEFRKQMSQK